MDNASTNENPSTPVSEPVVPVQPVQPAVSTEYATTPEEIKPSKNVFLSVLKSLVTLVVGIVVSFFKTLFNFFFQLSNKAKLSFLFIVVVVGLLVALIAHNQGFARGKLEVENRVENETGMTVQELIEVSDKLRDLNMTLDSILKREI
jgi:hypothetical protein